MRLSVMRERLVERPGTLNINEVKESSEIDSAVALIRTLQIQDPTFPCVALVLDDEGVRVVSNDFLSESKKLPAEGETLAQIIKAFEVGREDSSFVYKIALIDRKANKRIFGQRELDHKETAATTYGFIGRLREYPEVEVYFVKKSLAKMGVISWK